MTVIAADEADAAVLDELDRRLEGTPADPRSAWRQIARPDQLLPPLDQQYRVAFWRGGRGSGKTRTCAQALAELVLADTDGDGEYGIVAPTYADAWTKCTEGESGILRALGTSMAEVKDHRSKLVRSAWRTYGQVVLHNGTVIYIDSANDGALRVQGRNLKACWCDEIGLWEKWKIAWEESIRYAVRRGVSKIICDGTPKASRPARELVQSLLRDDPEHGGVISRRLRTVDNIDNLSPEFYRSVVGAAQGTALELQELEGELISDVPNALWTRELLNEIQCPAIGQPGAPAYLFSARIGVDPSDGTESSDEQAYTIIGKGPPDDGHLYVAENWGGQEAPAAFARRVILKAVQWEAEVIVERNHGGKWLSSTFDLVMKEMDREGLIPEHRRPRVRTVHASDAKRARAEPVSAMYLRRGPDGSRLVRHCKMLGRDRFGNADPQPLVELEDQMVLFTGARGERSPDRLDSLVWAMDPFKSLSFAPPGQAGIRRWAGSADLDRTAETEDSQMRRRLRGAHGGLYGGQETPQDAPWDLDGFSPAEDERQQPEHGRRGNVRAWR